MTTTDRDPLTLARDVLEACQCANADAPTFVERYRRIADRNAITDEHAHALARAVERMAELADELDEDAVYVRNAFSGLEGRRRAEERRSAAARIRAALNGETND